MINHPLGQSTIQPAHTSIATVAIAVLLLALAACAPSGGSETQPAIPPIDLAAPRKTETATFALG